nr:MAG TPA: hypothetical protein [Caudoviricetes sp.]
MFPLILLLLLSVTIRATKVQQNCNNLQVT